MPANARSHAVLTTESKVTIRGQTTIPAPVREALKLKPGQDSIHYEILPGGQVFMCRLGKPHPRDRRKPLMVFTMPAERIRVDQRAPFLTPRPESLQPQPFAVLPDYPQECLHQQ